MLVVFSLCLFSLGLFLPSARFGITRRLLLALLLLLFLLFFLLFFCFRPLALFGSGVGFFGLLLGCLSFLCLARMVLWVVLLPIGISTRVFGRAQRFTGQLLKQRTQRAGCDV